MTRWIEHLYCILLIGCVVALSSSCFEADAPEVAHSSTGDQPAVQQRGLSGWTESEILAASDARAYQHFGHSVAADRNLAIVGAYYDDTNGTKAGAAYIFEQVRGSPDHWAEVKKLLPSDGAPKDAFGLSVAIDGDVAVVGAYYVNYEGGDDRGAAYVFERNHGGPDNWGEVKKLLPSDGAPDDYFGTALAVSGDTIAVGARRRDGSDYDVGAVYMFQRDHGGVNNWGESAKLLVSEPQGSDGFGTAVSIDEDVLVVGASSVWADSSAAYIFERDGGSNQWVETKKLTYSGTNSYRSFGGSVSVSDDVVVVGANRAYSGGAGAAVIYERNHGGVDNWGESRELIPSDTTAGQSFGYSVSVSGDVVAVGAVGDETYGNEAGAAYIFERHQGGADQWGEVIKLLAAGGKERDWYGANVAANGNVVMVGASRGRPESWGAVYVHTAPNVGPEALDDSATLAEDDQVTVDILSNDIDGDGHGLDARVLTQPEHGTASVNPDQTITYLPNADFYGRDQLIYEVWGGFGGLDTATVSITVEPVNDAPFFIEPTPDDGERLSAVEGEEIRLRLAAEDFDDDSLAFDVSPLPQGASRDVTSGEFTWPLTFQDIGSHQLALTVSDGTVEARRRLSVVVDFLDEDEDGLPDTWEHENGLDRSTADSDGDFISDSVEVGDRLDQPRDTDGDGLLDALDEDSDEDGMPDAEEAGDQRLETPPIDTNGDGVPNYRDRDSDGDGIDDANDNCPRVENPDQADSDEDGQGDACDEATVQKDTGASAAEGGCTIPRATTPLSATPLLMAVLMLFSLRVTSREHR
ncbi:hypothetical protein FIV42_07520 [Persicimonas caeni]|uniref:Tandem-95 repeat protein n=1 Tax=Persicimonas caeni TaxID=2292766 RepID=A0A4Y6PQJ3_PERCE|nr:Ig-like domain-containing protein [Persicimonas caeni]QDG50588.1 hypothetical protein FIV42_07520 [Persicimonas caeni]QED31809.1 hypothetical protein FRD00_07515 [Persicimonas caeni]